jgi:hypothetical protein
MSSIPVSAKDMADTKRIAGIITKIDNQQNDLAFANWVTDEIYQHQPFLLSVMMGYKIDLPPEPLAELVKLYIVVWEYFKDAPNVRNVRITQQQYEKAESLQIATLQTLERLASRKQKDTVITNDLNKVTSKALVALMFTEFKERKALNALDPHTKGILLVGLKSFIQCFEDIVSGDKNK